LQRLWHWCYHIEVGHGYTLHKSHSWCMKSKGAESNKTSSDNVLGLSSGLSNTRLFAARPRYQRRSKKTGKSQKWTSYPTDTRQNPHPKNHEAPKKRTRSTKGRSWECDAST
jgi:hypothetical protein